MFCRGSAISIACMTCRLSSRVGAKANNHSPHFSFLSPPPLLFFLCLHSFPPPPHASTCLVVSTVRTMAVMAFPTPPASDNGDVTDTNDCPGCNRIRERESCRHSKNAGESSCSLFLVALLGMSGTIECTASGGGVILVGFTEAGTGTALVLAVLRQWWRPRLAHPRAVHCPLCLSGTSVLCAFLHSWRSCLTRLQASSVAVMDD